MITIKIMIATRKKVEKIGFCLREIDYRLGFAGRVVCPFSERAVTDY
jgi:hypothetical protein